MPTDSDSVRVVVVGSCMIDFSFYAPRLPKAGETLHGTKFVLGYGGKGANQCVAAAKLGGKTALVARLGDDTFGRDYLHVLKQHKITTDHVSSTEGVSSGMANIIIAENGENNIVIVAGANSHLSADDVNRSLPLLRSATVIVFQFETPVETTLHALKMNSAGISIVNGAPAVSNIDPLLFQLCSIFCVNESEASSMTGLRIESVSEATSAIAKFLERGCNTVIITLGKEGAVYATKEDPKPVHVPSVEVKPVDTTGAGDMFVGALAFYLAYFPELGLRETIRRCCHVAALSTQTIGTQTSFLERDQLPEELFIPNL